MGVAAHAHGHELDERRAVAGARALCRPGERGGDRVGIGAVDRDRGDAVADRLVREHAHGRLLAHRRRQRGLIVLHAEDGRQLARGAGVDRLVPFAERGGAFADEGDGDAVASSSQREGHRDAGDRQRRRSERRHGRKDSARPVADVQVLAVHRRAGLAHLRAEHHAHGRRGRCASPATAPRSRIIGETTSPRQPSSDAKSSAAAKADRGRVDRFLSERAEALALERACCRSALRRR